MLVSVEIWRGPWLLAVPQYTCAPAAPRVGLTLTGATGCWKLSWTREDAPHPCPLPPELEKLLGEAPSSKAGVRGPDRGPQGPGRPAPAGEGAFTPVGSGLALGNIGGSPYSTCLLKSHGPAPIGVGWTAAAPGLKWRLCSLPELTHPLWASCPRRWKGNRNDFGVPPSSWVAVQTVTCRGSVQAAP